MLNIFKSRKQNYRIIEQYYHRGEVGVAGVAVVHSAARGSIGIAV